MRGDSSGNVASIRCDSQITLDFGVVTCYSVSTMEVGPLRVGDLVRVHAEQDRQFHGSKGIIVRTVESNTYKQGFHYEVQTFDGHVIIALSFELEPLENEYHIPN